MASPDTAGLTKSWGSCGRESSPPFLPQNPDTLRLGPHGPHILGKCPSKRPEGRQSRARAQHRHSSPGRKSQLYHSLPVLRWEKFLNISKPQSACLSNRDSDSFDNSLSELEMMILKGSLTVELMVLL